MHEDSIPTQTLRGHVRLLIRLGNQADPHILRFSQNSSGPTRRGRDCKSQTEAQNILSEKREVVGGDADSPMPPM